jgi:hypothetical protein
MGRSSTNQIPALNWFFFTDREPQSVKEELLVNLQSQWMTLHLLERQGYKPELQEWAALGLYLVQFSRILERLPHRLAPLAETLKELLDEGWPQWVDAMTADSLAPLLKGATRRSKAHWKEYRKELEKTLCTLLAH